MRVAVLDDYQDVVRGLDCFTKLQNHEVRVYTAPLHTGPFEAATSDLADLEALVLIRERTAITAGFLEHLPRLKLICQTGKIGSHLDLAACAARGVTVTEGAGSPIAPAELTWALILASSRHLLPYSAALLRGQWQQNGGLGLGRTLRGLTLGIWGYGKIGRLVAGYGAAFGMRGLVWGREASRDTARAAGLEVAADARELFAESDVLSLHLRLNEATRGCVTPEWLALMKPDALFVNTSRAELVLSGALEAALGRGRPGFAALDVFASEPIGADHPLLSMPNVLCTPHLGFVERSSFELYLGAAFDALNAFAATMR